MGHAGHFSYILKYDFTQGRRGRVLYTEEIMHRNGAVQGQKVSMAATVAEGKGERGPAGAHGLKDLGSSPNVRF